MTPAQRNTYQLAENLGMTVTRMMREMTLSEYFGWVAFFAERAEEQKQKPRKMPTKPPKDGGITMRGFDL